MTKPILSIVIANYNYGRFLEDAIRSVLAQDVGDKAELIICDAMSSDASVEIIKKYANGLPPNTMRSEWDKSTQSQYSNSQLISWWCSEKDSGQSAAFNKGFSHARGEWLTWLNADEVYAEGVLKALFKFIENRRSAQWITGNFACFDDYSGKFTYVSWGPHVSPSFLSNQHYPSAVFGPTSFWRREAYLKVGLLDEKLHYAMDTDYWARMVMAGYRQSRLNCYCWLFREHQESKTVGRQTDKSLDMRRREKLYHTAKNGYFYEYSLRNPWYVFWLIWRVLDGSVFVRWWRKHTLIGEDVKLMTGAIR